jgi:hypothetical protein
MDTTVATGTETVGFRASSLEVAVTIIITLPKWVLNIFIKKNPTRCKNVSNFIIPYLCEAQHISSKTC